VLVERFAAYANLMTYLLLLEKENQLIVEFRSLFISAYQQLKAASKASFSLLDVFDLRSFIVRTLEGPIMLD
jgi:hypothetical protein